MDATPENAQRIMTALADFGAPMTHVAESDFAHPGVVFQIGVPPGRVDILTELTGLAFADAWADRVQHPFGEVEVNFLGRSSLIRNKKATGRPKDLVDIDGME